MKPSKDYQLLKFILCYNHRNLIRYPKVLIEPRMTDLLDLLFCVKRVEDRQPVYMSLNAATNLFNTLKTLLCASTIIATCLCAKGVLPMTSSPEYVWPILILGGMLVHKIAACEMPPYGNEK